MIRRPPTSTRTYTLLPYPDALPIWSPAIGLRQDLTSTGRGCHVAPGAGEFRMVAGSVALRAGRLTPCPSLKIVDGARKSDRSEEHTSQLQSLMLISYAVF